MFMQHFKAIWRQRSNQIELTAVDDSRFEVQAWLRSQCRETKGNDSECSLATKNEVCKVSEVWRKTMSKSLACAVVVNACTAQGFQV